jgi:hypothetical protein
MSTDEDKKQIEQLIMGAMVTRHNSTDPDVLKLTTNAEGTLRRCLENLEKVDDLMTKVLNLSEDLAIERSSNRRMKALFVDLAKVMYGTPGAYPPPLNELVRKIHDEAGVRS